MTANFPEMSHTQLRPLGPLERYSTTRSDLGIYLNVGLTASYRRPEGAVVKPTLFRALSKLISKHPILSAFPTAVDTENPFFTRLPEITLSEVVSFFEDDPRSQELGWQAYVDNVLEEQHNRPFELRPNQPLPFWRICVLECANMPTRFTLILIFHHSLMDTKSALSFHEELQVYMAQDTESQLVDMVSTPSTALLPPLEDLCTLSVPRDFLKDKNKVTEPCPNSWTAAPQSTPVRTCFSSLWLSAAETGRIERMSKKEQSSVTAVIQTMIAASLFQVLPTEYQTLQADCAVSLRRFLPTPITATSLGCYVGSLSVTYGRVPSFTFDEARRTKIAIEEAMAKKGNDMPVGYLGYISNLHLWLLQKLGKKRMSAFELSNVGISILVRRGRLKFELESMLFSQSSSACSAAIKVSAVTGPDGRLALGFTWQDGIVENGMVERTIQALKAEVKLLTVHYQ